MSEDLTKKTSDVEDEKLTLLLTIVRKLESHSAILLQIVDRLDKLSARVDVIETRLDAIETRLSVFETRLQNLEQSSKRLDRG